MQILMHSRVFEEIFFLVGFEEMRFEKSRNYELKE